MRAGSMPSADLRHEPEGRALDRVLAARRWPPFRRPDHQCDGLRNGDRERRCRRAVLRHDCPVLQVALAGISRAAGRLDTQGLNPRDLAMHVVLPEVDGRIFAQRHRLQGARRQTSAALRRPCCSRCRIGSMQRLISRRPGSAAPCEPRPRRVALVLANYPNRDGRLANGVGLDTPQSLVDVLDALRDADYDIAEAPVDADRT